MSCWQVKAMLENGAIAVFGLQAGSGKDARDLAHARLSEIPVPPLEVDVAPLPPPVRDAGPCQECGRRDAAWCWAWDRTLCEACRRIRTESELADGGCAPA